MPRAPRLCLVSPDQRAAPGRCEPRDNDSTPASLNTNHAEGELFNPGFRASGRTVTAGYYLISSCYVCDSCSGCMMRSFLYSGFLLLVTNAMAASEWVAVERQAVAEKLRLDGVIEAVRESTVSAQTAGTVVELPYDVDDAVDAGDLILRLDDTDQQARLDEAESALAGARAQRNDARQNFQRTRKLHERGSVSASELDQARNKLDGAKARVARMEASLAEARQQLAYTRVKAPYAGIVTERMVEMGESVQPGEPLMRGLSLEQLRVVVSLPQQYAHRVRTEREAVVALDDGRQLPTDNMTFYPYADEDSHNFRVRLALKEPQAELFPGMLVQVGIPLEDQESLWIPASSVYRHGELRAVFVRGPDDEPRLRQVRLGRRRDDRVEVLSGLSADEEVRKESLY